MTNLSQWFVKLLVTDRAKYTMIRWNIISQGHSDHWPFVPACYRDDGGGGGEHYYYREIDLVAEVWGMMMLFA